MKINEFIEKCKGVKDINEVIEIKKYIPIVSKRTIARDALDRNMDDINGFIEIDNVSADVSFTMGVVCACTGLEYDDIVSDYDSLCEAQLMDKIIEKIGADYFHALQVLEQEKDAVLTRNSIEAQVARVANSLVEAIDGLSRKLEDSIGDFNINQVIPEGTDLSQLFNMLKTLK